MSRTYEEFCKLMSAYNEADEKWTPIQKAHELLHSVNEDEFWEQRNAAANALYKYIAELEKALNIDTDLTIAGLRKELRDATARIAELEAERDDWRKSYINLWRHINNLPQPPEVQE